MLKEAAVRWSRTAFIGLALLCLGVTLRAADPAPALVLDIDGPIGPATSDFFIRSLNKAAERAAPLLILRMDTPGGLDTSMREMIRAILASPVPVVSYVAPSGARAASAGTFISYASHVAAMAPGTNLGAATPVQIGGPGAPSPSPDNDDRGKSPEEQPTEDGTLPDRRPGLPEKAINDAIAYIRSLAEMRGRNVEWAEKAVREAASLPASEALDKGVIDLIAVELDDLIAKLDGREVDVQGEARRLETKGLRLEMLEPDWRTKLLAIITNPNVAYILMLVGIYGLLFEFYSPGLIGPGIIGVICLLLALYAFHVLPVSYTGLALTLLGLGLMIAETLSASGGALGLGGIAAFVIGSIMLIETEAPGFSIAWELIGGIAFVASVLLLALLIALRKVRGRAVVSGAEEMIGSTGAVLDWGDREGWVWVHGERWRARSQAALEKGKAVRITRIEGLTLVVEPEQQRRVSES